MADDTGHRQPGEHHEQRHDRADFCGRAQLLFVPLPFARRVAVAHATLGRSRRLAKSFENTTESATGWLQVACITAVLTLFR